MSNPAALVRALSHHHEILRLRFQSVVPRPSSPRKAFATPVSRLSSRTTKPSCLNGSHLRPLSSGLQPYATYSRRNSSTTAAMTNIANNPIQPPPKPSVELEYKLSSGFPSLSSEKQLAVIGFKDSLTTEALLGKLRENIPDHAVQLYEAMVDDTKGGEAGSSTSTWIHNPDGQLKKLFVGVLPSKCSRHNCTAQPHALTSLVKSVGSAEEAAVVVVVEEAAHAQAAACAVARAFPLFSMKTTAAPSEPGKPTPAVRVSMVLPSGEALPSAVTTPAVHAAQGVRRAALIVDTPPQDMNVSHFVEQAREVAEGLEGVTMEVVRGAELRERGFGGIWGVGKAAEDPPALVVLSYSPLVDTGGGRTVALVGKGIVYDTGGLKLKSGEGMCGMKSDCGGAAGVLGAFEAVVRDLAGRAPDAAPPAFSKLHAVLCLAENCINQAAFRNDDILTLYSGLTVEINNTDAEGRLVLGDGVAYASRALRAEVVVDMATLTGAQMVATGKRHAGVVASTEALESAAVAAGRASGDLAHALMFCPEMFQAEFKSAVADMKNSVKDRSNGQASCAAQFIFRHLESTGFEGQWLHVDMAGPSMDGDRATGYGVALLQDLVTNRLGAV